ncbi:hypothetical protein LNKW23_16540 [Paralimibaculum aggregatum]|uniref:Serine protease n=1 Tax=Paralimibaculum aggregatum TaxID=3036245 RepID=A0ABQ6LGL2_9RHOB|nr:trypsin-like peptidase domain-containing protein [Limibaculum sp. NKW23]GMG82441.1 hypothetical protein LNKW23_16540 [Limibaculum sp. NKW23]
MTERDANADPAADEPPIVAALHHLTGRSRGQVSWLSREAHGVHVSDSGAIRVTADGRSLPGMTPCARFHQAGRSYVLDAVGEAVLWVNRVPLRERHLHHGDMIEFGEQGPLSRFELIDAQHPIRRTLPEILSDMMAYLRVSRRPLHRRLPRALGGLALSLLKETTILFRVSVVLALAVIIVLGIRQGREIDRIEADMRSGATRLDAISTAIARDRETALRPGDLDAVRQELGQAVQRQSARIETLEFRWKAGAEAIAGARGSIAFLHGSFGLRDGATGRMLRHAVDATGRPLSSPLGRPLLTLEGDGPVAEREFTGTGFLVGGGRLLATNRHVALPWERDAATVASAGMGLEPVMLVFRGYFPDRPEPLELSLRAASDSVDLAVLDIGGPVDGLADLPLAEAPPRIGAEIIAMGYPTGLRAMLAQSGDAFVAALQAEAQSLDLEGVAARLAEAGHIRPLASRGIVGQISPEAVVFDAETTHGGSGGPLLDLSGHVVAIQSAIVPEFGGSNLGVPAVELRRLLDTLESAGVH